MTKYLALVIGCTLVWATLTSCDSGKTNRGYDGAEGNSEAPTIPRLVPFRFALYVHSTIPDSQLEEYSGLYKLGWRNSILRFVDRYPGAPALESDIQALGLVCGEWVGEEQVRAYVARVGPERARKVLSQFVTDITLRREDPNSPIPPGYMDRIQPVHEAMLANQPVVLYPGRCRLQLELQDNEWVIFEAGWRAGVQASANVASAQSTRNGRSALFRRGYELAQEYVKRARFLYGWKRTAAAITEGINPEEPDR